ncbi:MAG: DMT family transporter [Gammaproteobacteria bacterium]|nr:DMT family transporter [Gammaproteobacteria bacterium]
MDSQPQFWHIAGCFFSVATMPVLSQHLKGVIITALGVLIISPDGLLTRLIHVDHWTLIFWRALLLSFGMWILTSLVHPNQTWRAYREMGRHGLLMVVLYSIGTISFITAITHTSVANTLIILSTTPLFAALIGFVVLREKIELRTWCAIFLVVVGVYVISSDSGNQTATLFGDIAAMVGAFFLAAGFTVVRVKPTISVFPVISTSGLVTALVIMPLAQPFAVTQQDMGFLIIMGVYMLPLGTGLMYIGPKYIPASEVGLMLLLESVLGPTWVWLALDEKPGLSTFIGGAIILGTLAINTLWAMKSAAIARRMRSLPG